MANTVHHEQPGTVWALAVAAALLTGGLLLLLAAPPPPGSPAGPPATDTLEPGAYLPFVHRSPASVTPPAPGDWLAYVNYYRALAELPPVAEDSAFSDGAALHARYVVKTDVLAHTEDPSSPWYTPAGLAAAEASSLAASADATKTNEWAIDSFMQAPFHAVSVLDSALLTVGFGSYREADGGLQMAAALDVIRGLTTTVPAAVSFPIIWPAGTMVAPLRLHSSEAPSPLTSCPGYSAPAGLPLIVQIGPGDVVPDVTAHSFRQGATALAHCVFDETDYANPDATLQSLGRAILDARDAIVLIPRQPLTPGASYSVSITANGETYDWAFSVASGAAAAD